MFLSSPPPSPSSLPPFTSDIYFISPSEIHASSLGPFLFSSFFGSEGCSMVILYFVENIYLSVDMKFFLDLGFLTQDDISSSSHLPAKFMFALIHLFFHSPLHSSLLPSLLFFLPSSLPLAIPPFFFSYTYVDAFCM